MRRIVDNQHDGQRGISVAEIMVILAISMIMVALTAKSMQSAVNIYRMTSSCRQLSAMAQLGRQRASGKSTRYRVSINTTAGSYWLEYCSSPNGSNCDAWTTDATTPAMTLPPGISFSASGITLTPPDQTGVTQATEMTFNSMGILYDAGTNAPANGRCFYLQAAGDRPMAVCTTMAGKTTVFQLSGSNWETQ